MQVHFTTVTVSDISTTFYGNHLAFSVPFSHSSTTPIFPKFPHQWSTNCRHFRLFCLLLYGAPAKSLMWQRHFNQYIVTYSVVKVPWTQGNAVPVPPVIEILRSHTSNFIKRVPNHLFGAHFCPKLIYSSLTSDFPLQPLYLLTYILSLLTRRTLITAELQTFSRNHKVRR